MPDHAKEDFGLALTKSLLRSAGNWRLDDDRSGTKANGSSRAKVHRAARKPSRFLRQLRAIQAQGRVRTLNQRPQFTNSSYLCSIFQLRLIYTDNNHRTSMRQTVGKIPCRRTRCDSD